MNIRPATSKDLLTLASIYTESFNAADPNKHWSYDSALALLEYWFKKQPDLFYVAVENSEPIGAMVVNIKPWRDGNRCHDGLLFVARGHQRSGVGKKLFIKVLQAAIEKYHTNTFEGITFAGKEFPLTWYERIGISQDTGAALIKGNCKEILEKLRG